MSLIELGKVTSETKEPQTPPLVLDDEARQTYRSF
jgi:hypothetical protein